MLKKKNKEQDLNKIFLYVVVFFIGVIPLIVKAKIVEFSYFNFDWMKKITKDIDLFMYYKSKLIIIIGVIALLRLIYLIYNKRTEKSIFTYLLILLSFIAVLSFTFSSNKEIAIWGFRDRFEGVFVLISYYIVAIYIFNEVNNSEKIDFIIKKLYYVLIFITIFGMLQYFGHGIMRTDFGRFIIGGTKIGPHINFSVDPKRVFLTISNPNYVGSLVALILPIIAEFFLNKYNDKSKKKYILLIIYISFILILSGSKSRAGFVGGGIGIVAWGLINAIRSLKRTNKKKAIVAIAMALSFFVIFLVDGNNADRFKSGVNDLGNVESEDAVNLDRMVTGKDKIEFRYENQDYYIKADDKGKYAIYNSLTDEKNVDLDIMLFSKGSNDDGGLTVLFNKKVTFRFVKVADGYRYINGGNNYVKIDDVDYIDIKGREQFASGRGYIWSRSIPLIIKQPLLGYGPDTYAAVFPQTDYIGKFKGFGDSKRLSETVVDKPHNTYIQYAVNTGVISLIIYLVINFLILYKLWLIIKYNKNEKYIMYSIAFFASILGYGFTAIFNDSSVVVSSIYWGIIGLSAALINIENLKRGVSIAKK